MIEPQNTMMPLPAESAPADAPQGEAGFGEMLAQTLGMTLQVDAGAIARLLGNKQDGGDADGSHDEAAPDLAGQMDLDRQDHVVTGRFIKPPVAGEAAVPVETGVVRPPAVDPPITGPVFDDGIAAPTPALPDSPPITPPTDLQPAEPHPVRVGPIPTAPRDGIWKPVLTDHGNDVMPQAAPEGDGVTPGVQSATSDAALPTPARNVDQELVGAEPAPADLPPRTESAAGAPVGPEVPIGDTPELDPPADSNPPVSAGTRDFDAEQLAPRDSAPAQSQAIPTGPTPDLDLPQASVPQANVAQTSRSQADLPPVPATGPRQSVPSTPTVDLGVSTPVVLDDAEIQIGGRATVPIADSGVAVESSTAPAPAGMPIGEAVPAQSASAVGGPAPTMPTQNTALAERVLQAVEMQANQPPPRTMVVDIPEIEGLRLVVSVRSGSEVHVVPSSSSAPSDGLGSFMDELQGVLTNRGFVMTGDGRRRGHNPQDEDQQEPQRAQRPTFRRPQPTDNDLRI